MRFVKFETAKKLKEKGFSIPTNEIIAMYNKNGTFHSLTTSAEYYTTESGYTYRQYYDFDDFNKHDYVCPTTSQVVEWLRKTHDTHIGIDLNDSLNEELWTWTIYDIKERNIRPYDGTANDYDDAVINAIDFTIDYLI